MDMFDDMTERVHRLKNGLSDAQIALREFSQQPGVTPWQIHEFEQMTKEMERLQQLEDLRDREKRLSEQLAAVPPEGPAAPGQTFGGAAEKGSAEAFSRIINAMAGSRKAPEEKTAKNTEKMAAELVEVRRGIESIENKLAQESNVIEIPG
jgi:hypothetical protein